MSETNVGNALHPLLLRKVVAALDTAAADLVGAHDLTADRWRMLEVLVLAGPMSMARLSEELSLAGATATRVADRLVGDALAYRDVDPDDRRRVVLRAAERGRALHAELSPEVTRAQEHVLAGLGEAERAGLARLAHALAGAPPLT
ncbi:MULTISPECIES: MarR family winged helix-turn-helix transcriptional regulator [Nocardiopsis]|uniref:MarR family transcriptional regulator n=2 Tax=Nocardiopsis alba TaxID=53437 RepID=A0A7K2IYR6_9ACTN|nr:MULTISPECIES: MarR family transcriptional regulator [Nocardiopsis]MEC3891569.1 MarR family transcriptional regulator [Nocardiopsis sp. LDBS1602]MYR35093.1 MarR family transcriptional regulator [Nocardiopsis alba]